MAETEKLVIKVSDVKNYLADGTTRLKSDKNYHPDKKSIEEIYNLSPAEVRDLFKEELLKGVRTVAYVPKRWTLVEEQEETTTSENTAEESSENASEESPEPTQNNEDIPDMDEIPSEDLDEAF